MKGKFIVMDGTDGSGKSTQMELLLTKLKKLKIRFKYIKFPRYEDNMYGQLVAQYLRGELGEMQSIDSRLIALMYAGDRNLAKPMIEKWLNQGYLVVADRYVSSNQAFTAGRMTPKQGDKFIAWIDSLEYGENKLPKEDLIILLYADPKRAQQNVDLKGHRAYMGKQARDIHEDNLNYQQKVAQAYLRMAKNEPDHWAVIDCMKGKTMDSREAIHERILSSLQQKKILR